MPGDMKKLSGFVGFANYPNQVHRKSIKEGFEFTLLVVGDSGLGKSTFVNSLFNTNVVPSKSQQAPSSDVEIETRSQDIMEGGVKLRLNVLNAVNFGIAIDNSKSWEPILKEVEDRYDAFLDEERRVNRRNITDRRVHCCLYFISPYAHGLRELDVEFLKRLHEKVNIIPVISKSDCMTPEERKEFKKRILADLAFNQISIYEIEIDPDDDEETRTKNREFKDAIPFAVMGAAKEYEIGGKKIRARKYPWGLVDVENEEYSDFIKLRNMMIKTHMVDLCFRTNELYEKYRAEKLLGDLGGGSGGSKNPLDSFEEEKKQHEAKLKKMEKEMKQVFEQKVKEKEEKLKQTEQNMKSDHAEKKSSLEKEIRELEEKKRAYDKQIEEASTKKPKKKSGLF